MKILTRLPRRYALLGALGILLVVLVIAAACGEEATPTPAPAATATPRPAATATPRPAATATPAPVATPVPGAKATPKPAATATPKPAATATAVPVTTGLRPRSQWTPDNPATREEIEAELAKYSGKSFIFRSCGGAYQSAQRNAFIIPFEEQFNIDVIEESPCNYSFFTAAVETGNFTFDILDMGGDAVYAFSDRMEPIDLAVVDNRNQIGVWNRSVLNGNYGAGGSVVWSTVVAYNTDSYPTKPPDTMDDFYDYERYPGPRGWWNYHNFEIRAAQVALHPALNTEPGKPGLTKLSDAQVDESLAFLRDHRSAVKVYEDTGSDCPQLLIAGDLDMCSAWNGRIWNAEKEGAPITICWTCGYMISTGGYVMPKGLKAAEPERYDLAMLYTAWTNFPEINKRISLFITYGPPNLDAWPLLDEPEFDEIRPFLPTAPQNVPYSWVEDEIWSGQTYDDIFNRYLTEVQTAD